MTDFRAAAVDPREGWESFGLGGRSAIVTGAGSVGEGIGNGRASAILLARAGAGVTLVDLHGEAAEVTAATIRAEGGQALVVEADVADAEGSATVVDAAVAEFGAVDVLVNNVGIAGPRGDATAVDPEAWDAAMRVNVASMMLMAKFAVPLMEEGGGGSIVNISSAAGLLAGHPNLLYPTSKGAVVQLTRSMAMHHGSAGIRVNCVAPGAVNTPMAVAHGLTPELREVRRRRSLLKTEGSGWDIGLAVAFLSGSLSRWITGVVLPVDAGYAAAGMTVATPPRQD